MSLLSDVTRATLTPGAELELEARDGRADREADERGLDAVRRERLDELVAGRLDAPRGRA